ncbi:helix-turn-helix domain-containing protein [Enterococcus sp. MJM12]|uniref:Helix-turn-helix domain-containing protein n=1 Tax=Candidatus Enterococcus myersii TaxID=2815322 RepID=A0ABS3HB18_9ENTE|nr:MULTISPECIES: AraC family transcriptional regulator [unclassified Enterococcus]MBO0449793.1 helix-turn-helix domain-containing protein [Enterococcus sp. MJM12]MCD1023750.1 helix-turn-helix domain-containing protein [Enterococcus sp. SMC-9]
MVKEIDAVLKQAELIYVHQSKFSEEDWHSTLHTHYFTEVMYVLSGRGSFIVEGKEYPIAAHDIVVVNPYVRHTEKSSGEFPLWYIVIGVNNIRFVKQNKRESHYIFRDVLDEMVPLLKLIIAEINEKQQGANAVLQRLAEVVLVKVLRSNNFSLIEIENKNISKDGAIIKDFIDQHYKENLTLDVLSRQLHLDKYYMIHIFKENFAETPMNYMMQKRLENAQELLISTDYSVGQIAEIAGFTSQSYFNQAFKKGIGTSPNQYRKHHR